MKHTIVCLASKRIEVKPSPTLPGHILFQILGADRQHQASVTITAEAAHALMFALELEEKNAQTVLIEGAAAGGGA